MFISTPSFSDTLQMFTDGTTRIPFLEVPGEFILTPHTSGSRPICNAASDAGMLYYDTTDGLCYCDGASWKKVDGGAAC